LLAATREVYAPLAAAPYTAAQLTRVKTSAAAWEDALRRAVMTLFANIRDAKIEAVCISGNGPTLVPVDRSGAALTPLYWFGATVRSGVSPSFFLPHAAHFMQEFPREYEKTRCFYSCQEWLSARLGAESVTVLPAKTYAPFYWDEAGFASFGLEREKFLPFVQLGSIIGRTNEDAMQIFGIPKNIPIVAGGPDFVMALLGTSCVEAGLVCDRSGTSEGINVCVTESEAASHRAEWQKLGLRMLPHVMDGLWNVSVVLGESGIRFDRWRVESGNENKSYDELLQELIPDEVLQDAHIPLEKVHPVLLEISNGVKEALALLKLAGIKVGEMRLSGGQAKNPRWNLLKARLLNCTLLLPQIPDAELAGDAALSAFALGEAPSIKIACKNLFSATSVK
jgi:xylulokinase